MQAIVSTLLQAGQDATFEVAIELARLDRRLAQIAESLPLPVDSEDLFEERVPATAATQLYGVIGGVKGELKEMIEVLLESAQISEAALRSEFRRHRQQLAEVR
jgi:hypothetical protein